ncbi:methyltransferase domain-containing protein [Bacteroidota bacterium]
MSENSPDKINVKDNILIMSKDFPEHRLGNRVKLSYKWIDGNVENLLDGGCSYGYGTRFLAEKSKNTYAIDVNETHIEVASKRYTDINFKTGILENTEYSDNFFDYIVLNDVLEHTTDKIQTLQEMYRILKPGGTIIISTPHKGMFAFIDPYNYGYNLRKFIPWLYKGLYKIIRLIKEGKIPGEFNPKHIEKHWHYSIKDFRNMLDSTGFNDNYRIEKTFRSGLFMEVLVMNLESILNIFFKQRISQFLLKPLSWLAEIDYWIPYGILSYNIAVKIKKK